MAFFACQHCYHIFKYSFFANPLNHFFLDIFIYRAEMCIVVLYYIFFLYILKGTKLASAMALVDFLPCPGNQGQFWGSNPPRNVGLVLHPALAGGATIFTGKVGTCMQHARWLEKTMNWLKFNFSSKIIWNIFIYLRETEL